MDISRRGQEDCYSYGERPEVRRQYWEQGEAGNIVSIAGPIRPEEVREGGWNLEAGTRKGGMQGLGN